MSKINQRTAFVEYRTAQIVPRTGRNQNEQIFLPQTPQEQARKSQRGQQILLQPSAALPQQCGLPKWGSATFSRWEWNLMVLALSGFVLCALTACATGQSLTMGLGDAQQSQWV